MPSKDKHCSILGKIIILRKKNARILHNTCIIKKKNVILQRNLSINNKKLMKSIEQIKKIEAVVLYVLQYFEQGVDYIKLFKIMYFAQREYLAKYGKVLCPDTFKARQKGPVPALSNKVIKIAELHDEDILEYPDLMSFIESIKVQDQLVFATKEPNLDYLSGMERKCLDKWYLYCKDKNSKEELSPESHDSAYEAAWERYQRDPQQGFLSSLEIAVAGGASEKMRNYIYNKELLMCE